MNMPGFERSADRLPPAYRLYQVALAGLDLVYPPYCGGCKKPGARWCLACQQAARLVLPPFCEICGQSAPSGRLCLACRANLPAYCAVRSWAFFDGPLRQALHRLKYSGEITLGDALAQPLVSLLDSLSWPVDLVVPVPLGVARRAERGYNQAALLAWPLALRSGISYQSRAVRKVRETRSQVGLGVLQRFENVSGAFEAQADLVRAKTVLVVDDVTTTGATLQSMAQALLAAGCRQVYGLTLARAVQSPVPQDVVDDRASFHSEAAWSSDPYPMNRGGSS